MFTSNVSTDRLFNYIEGVPGELLCKGVDLW